jgi:hypothetical protein
VAMSTIVYCFHAVYSSYHPFWIQRIFPGILGTIRTRIHLA